MKEIIEFKSISEYFHDEKDGLKNHTERIIDMQDDRFKTLLRAWKEKDYPLIRICHKDLARGTVLATDEKRDTMDSFVRDIQHIALWNDIMSITWKHEEEESQGLGTLH